MSSDDRRLTLSFCGPFALIDADGKEIHIGRKRSKGIIALLALSSRGVRQRRWLQDKLWSDRDSVRGADSLRQELSYLRKLQKSEGIEFLEIGPEIVSLDLPKLTIELPRPSTDANRSELLEGLDIGDPEFEDWLREQRFSFFEKTSESSIISSALESTEIGLADTPSTIFVSDFVTIGGDDLLTDFARGFKSELMSSLSSIGTQLKVSEGLPSELEGEHYLLSGTMRAISELRLIAQLEKYPNRQLIWSGRFSEDPQDTLVCQERLARGIVEAIQEILTDGDMVAIWNKHRTPLQAWDLYQSGRKLEAKHTRDGHIKAREKYIKALEIDPSFLPARIVSTFIKVDELRLGWADDFNETFSLVEAEFKELAADHPGDLYVEILGSYIQCLSGKHDEALLRIEKAMRHVPDSPELKAYRALVFEANDRSNEAIQLYVDALELTPFPPNWIRTNLALAYLVVDHPNTEEALDLALAYDPRSTRATIGKTALLVRKGELDKARRWGEALRVLQPDFSAAEWRNEAFYKNRIPIRKIADELRKAGL